MSENRKTCSHVNKQHIGISDALEDLTCELEEGHSGDHEAPYKTLKFVDGVKDPRKEYIVKGGKEYLIETETAYWNDGAGKTYFEYQDEMAEKRAALEEFKKHNPGMSEAHKQKARELGLIPENRA